MSRATKSEKSEKTISRAKSEKSEKATVSLRKSSKTKSPEKTDKTSDQKLVEDNINKEEKVIKKRGRPPNPNKKSGEKNKV